jgi:hypothetical protein
VARRPRPRQLRRNVDRRSWRRRVRCSQAGRKIRSLISGGTTAGLLAGVPRVPAEPSCKSVRPRWRFQAQRCSLARLLSRHGATMARSPGHPSHRSFSTTAPASPSLSGGRPHTAGLTITTTTWTQRAERTAEPRISGPLRRRGDAAWATAVRPVRWLLWGVLASQHDPSCHPRVTPAQIRGAA